MSWTRTYTALVAVSKSCIVQLCSKHLNTGCMRSFVDFLSPRKPELPIEMEFSPDEEPNNKEPAAGDPVECWDPRNFLSMLR